MSTTTQAIKAVWNPDAKPFNKRGRTAAKLKKAARPAKPPKRFSKHNAAFEACYRGHVVPEEQWEDFSEYLRAPLPTTFSFVHTGCAEVEPALVQARFEALLLQLSRGGEGAVGSSSDVPEHFPSFDERVARMVTMATAAHAVAPPRQQDHIVASGTRTILGLHRARHG